MKLAAIHHVAIIVSDYEKSKDGATGFLIHPVQIGLGIRNFRLNLKNVCTDSICQIFGNFCGDTAGRKIGDKSFAHDNALPLDNFV